MKTTAILILIATAFCASAQSNTMPTVASPAPRWIVVESPREWPHQTDGSNSLIRCVDFVEAEIAKASSFLLKGSYRIIEGGPKRDVPHVVVPYPDAPSETWTIFFKKETLQPYSIERKGCASNRYLIQLDPHTDLLTNLTSANYTLCCDPPGSPRGFAVPIRDRLEYSLVWDGKGHLSTEDVYDWSKRGKVIKR